MMLADDTSPLSSASKLATLAEWEKARSSAWRMTSFEPAGYPRRSAIVRLWAKTLDTASSDTMDDQNSARMRCGRKVEKLLPVGRAFRDPSSYTEPTVKIAILRCTRSPAAH